MGKILAFFCAFLVLGSSAFAQNGTVRGAIKDGASSEPLPFVNVAVDLGEDGMTGGQSDFDGNYTVSLPAGTHTLKFSYVGYENKEVEVTIAAGESKTMDVMIEEESLSLNTVVVTSNKFEKPIGEVTVSMEVIKPDFIENANTTQVDEAIEKIPGVNIIDGQANIRGGSGYSYGAGSRVLLLVDDLPMLTGDAGFPNWDFVPVENIEQVEVVKGAASALYGSSALNGIINIRTAYAKSKPVTKISLFGGIYQNPRDNNFTRTLEDGSTEEVTKAWWDDPEQENPEALFWVDQPFQTGLSVSHKQKFGQFDLVAGTYLYNRESWRKDEFNRRARVNLGTRYRFKNISGLSLGANFNFQRGYSGTFFIWNGDEEQMYKPWSSVATPLNKSLRMTVDPFVTYFDANGNRHKILSRFYRSENTNNTNQSNSSNLYYGEYQFQKNWEESEIVMSTGVVGTYATIEAELYGDTTYATNNLAGYLQLDKKFYDKLNISFGARYEMNKLNTDDEWEAKPVFRFGANYELGQYTFLRGSWGQGYRYPTIAERYVETNLGFLGIFANPTLESETGWSAELGLKQGLKLGEWKGFADLSVFYTEYQNMMEFTFGGANGLLVGFQSVNIGDTQIAGTEVTLAGQGELFGKSTDILLGYTYIDPKHTEWDTSEVQEGEVETPGQKNARLSSNSDNVLKYRFRHTAKIDVQTKITPAWSIGGNINYLSYMEAVDAIFETVLPDLTSYRERNKDKPSVFVGMRTALQMGKNELSLVIGNLLNSEYSVRPAMVEAPRNFTLKYTLTL